MPFSSRALPLHSRASLSSPRTVLTHPMHSTACTLLAFLPTLLCLCPRGRDEREHRSSLSRYGSGRKKTVVVVGKTLLYLIPIVLAALGVMNSEPAPSYLEKKRRGREKKKKKARTAQSHPQRSVVASWLPPTATVKPLSQEMEHVRLPYVHVRVFKEARSCFNAKLPSIGLRELRDAKILALSM